MGNSIGGITRLVFTSPDEKEVDHAQMKKQVAEINALYKRNIFYVTLAFMVAIWVGISLVILYLRAFVFSLMFDELAIGVLTAQILCAAATTWLFAYPAEHGKRNIFKMNLFLSGAAITFAIAYFIPSLGLWRALVLPLAAVCFYFGSRVYNQLRDDMYSHLISKVPPEYR